MRSHLATLPLPPRKKTEQPQLGDRTQSDSSSTHSEHDHEPTKGKNPKRSLKASDPEFLDAGSIVQDRESETESTQNPTRKRSKRGPSQTQKPSGSHKHDLETKKLKPDHGLVKSESVTESTPVSSVSDASQDEEVALCLMMLSRDVWEDNSNDSSELKTTTRSTTRGTTARFKCSACKKTFRTNRALTGHIASSKECHQEMINYRDNQIQKIYECPFCYKVFGSGQALGGHKRSHLLGSSTNTTNVVASNVDKIGDSTSFVLDLNLPAPVEDDEDHNHLHFS